MREIDFLEAERKVRSDYSQVSQTYRRDDEVEVTTENHRHLGRRLKEVCHSFEHPIRALDVGCGTGRYFHCLENVRSLVGLDVSEEMLTAAREPVRAEELSVGAIELRRGNVYLADFAAGSFDFIYCLGMFGHGCPLTLEVCDKFFQWLAPGGRLFFNAIDPAGLPVDFRFRRWLRSLIYPVAGKSLRRWFDERERLSPFFCLSRQELEQLMARTPFNRFEISSRKITSPLWKGRHLECLAIKPPA